MIDLQGFIDAPDFGAAARAMGEPLCQHYGLPPFFQFGLVVPDADAAAQALAATGIPTAYSFEGKPDLWIEQGVEKDPSTRLVFAYHQDYELELIQPGLEASFYARDLDPQGRVVVQHLGLMVQDVDYWVARLTSGGVPLMVRGRIRSGPVTANFAYFDTREKHGVILELICLQLFGIHLKKTQPLYTLLGRLQRHGGERR